MYKKFSCKMYRSTVTARELIFVWMAKIIFVPVRIGTETKNHGSIAVRPCQASKDLQSSLMLPIGYTNFLVPVGNTNFQSRLVTPIWTKDIFRVSLKIKHLYSSQMCVLGGMVMRVRAKVRVLSLNPTSYTFFLCGMHLQSRLF